MVNLGFRSVSMPIQRFPHGARERVYSPNHGRMVHSVSVAGVIITYDMPDIDDVLNAMVFGQLELDFKSRNRSLPVDLLLSHTRLYNTALPLSFETSPVLHSNFIVKKH